MENFCLSYDNICNVDSLKLLQKPLPMAPPNDKLWISIKKVIDPLHYVLSHSIIYQKSSKVNHYCDFNFHQKFFKHFEMMKVFKNFASNILGVKTVNFLFCYLRKTWRAGLVSLKFCVQSNLTMLYRILENNIFTLAALLCANIVKIFSKATYLKRHLENLLKGIVQLVPTILLTCCQEPAGIESQSIVN